MSDSNFQWRNSHWAFTVVLSLLTLSFVLFYAHINYSSTNGNQFLSVAATLSSIILAVVAIVIAIAQMVMAGQHSSQFEGKIFDLKSAVDRMQPLPASVMRLEELIDGVKQTRTAIYALPDIISSQLREAGKQTSSLPEEQQASADGLNASQLVKRIARGNTYLFTMLIGGICAAHGRNVRVDELGPLVMKPLQEKSKYPEAFDDTILTSMGYLLKNLDLVKIAGHGDDSETVYVNDLLRNATKAWLQQIVDDPDGETDSGQKLLSNFALEVHNAIPTA